MAPTVTTGRLRRSKPDNSNHDQANPGQDRPVNTSGQVQSTSLTDVEMSNRSRGDGVSVEDPQAGDSLDCQSYTSPPGTFSHGHNVSYTSASDSSFHFFVVCEIVSYYFTHVVVSIMWFCNLSVFPIIQCPSPVLSAQFPQKLPMNIFIFHAWQLWVSVYGSLLAF